MGQQEGCVPWQLRQEMVPEVSELWRIHVSSHLIALWTYQVNSELLKDPLPQINKISTMFPAGIPPLPLSTAQSAPGKQGVWGAGISIGRSWGAGTGGLRSDTSNLRPVLCPSSCSSSSVTAQCHCAMASETSEAPHAVCVYSVLQQECRAIPRAAVSEAWNGKGKEIAVKLPGIATARVLQSACEKPRQVFRWIQELFAKSMGLMFPRLSC